MLFSEKIITVLILTLAAAGTIFSVMNDNLPLLTTCLGFASALLLPIAWLQLRPALEIPCDDVEEVSERDERPVDIFA